MNGNYHPSGDVLLDRRFAYAVSLSAEGDAVAAADLLRQILERAPDWAPAWAALADAEERQEKPEAAMAAYGTLDCLDPTGRFGAKLHLARLRGDAISPAMSDSYVAALFDGYAPRFEHHLVDDLAYCGPKLILDAIDGCFGRRRYGRVLDLGCGTGLMGALMRERSETIDGIDLSPRMLALARATGLYRTLVVGGNGEVLAGFAPHSYDLVLAADVFVYMGALEAPLGAAARVLAPGGVVAFTAQTTGIDGVRLGPDLRYAHSESHVRAALRGAGFGPPTLMEASFRREAGHAVPGLVAVAMKA